MKKLGTNHALSGHGIIHDAQSALPACRVASRSLRMLPNPREIASTVPMPQLLRAVGCRLRGRKRADCRLCHGRSTGTLVFTQTVWYCHRCQAGGDAFSLVQAVNGCKFPEALGFVAGLAGIPLKDLPATDLHRERTERQRQRDQIDAAAEKLMRYEGALQFRCRDRIHELESKSWKASDRLRQLYRGEPENFAGETETLWEAMQAAFSQLRNELVMYSLLAFGAVDLRARFVLHPEERERMIAEVLSSGFVPGASNRQAEVLA